MQEGQDWCLKCGAGVPGRGRVGPGWRSAALVLGSTVVLVLGAAAAAYAALQQGSPAKPPTPVAQTPTITATTSTTSALPPSTGTPQSTPPPSTTTPKEALSTPNTPPKISGATKTPTSTQKSKTSTTTTTSSTTSTGSTTSTTSSSKEETPPAESEVGQPGEAVAVLLDTNAAAIYNPRNLAESRFGDPSLAIDGDTTTAWTMQLEGSEAPQVGAGLSLDLKAPLKIAQLTLITETLGITVQVYGTKAGKLPQTLSSKEWVALSHAHLVKKRKASINLSESKKSFRQLLVWIVKAPTSTGGQFTGSDVAINEIQLYEPSSGSQG